MTWPVKNLAVLAISYSGADAFAAAGAGL